MAPFAVVALAMAGTAVLATSLILLEPAWILTAGLMLSVFSGNWGNMHVPIPLDRVAIVCGLGSVLVRSLRGRSDQKIRVRRVHWLMLLLILYAIGSAAWSGTLTSHGPLFALLDRLGVIPFALYLVAPVAFRTTHQRRILAIGLLVLGVYLALITLFEAIGLSGLVVPNYILNPALGIHAGRGRGPFLEAGANGLAMFECLVAAAVTLSWWRDQRVRVAVLGVMALCTAGILFTLTRQIWVGAGVGAVAAMLAHRRLRAWLPLAATGAAVVVVIALVLVPGLSQSVSQRASDQASIWDRLNSDAAALRMAEARPALGFGWGEFGSASIPYYRLASTYPLTSVSEAHNLPLSNAAELGLVGLLLWLGILLFGLGGPAVRRAPPELEPWRLGLIAIGAAWFIQCNLSPLDYAFPNYVVWLWAGVVAGGMPRQRRAVAVARVPGTAGGRQDAPAETQDNEATEKIPVAVIIPAYNRAGLLPRALASIAAQKPYQPSEVIVVDDGSDDDTAAVAERLGARIIRHQTNLGPAAARNSGFAATDQPWLMQLDSDDEWLPHCLATLWALRNGHVLISGGSLGQDMSGRPWYNGPIGDTPRQLGSPADLAFPDNFIASSAVMLRASCVHEVGGYHTDLRYAEDLDLWLRMLESGRGVATPTVVSLYHSHPHQATSVRGEVHGGHAQVLSLSANRPWWDPALSTRWSAIPRWDACRRALSEGDRWAATGHALGLITRSQRLVGLVIVLRYRLQRRRRSTQMTLEGRPSVAVLPGAGAVPRAQDIDLRGCGFPAALLHLGRRPTAMAVVGRRWQVPVVRMLGVKPECRASCEQRSDPLSEHTLTCADHGK